MLPDWATIWMFWNCVLSSSVLSGTQDLSTLAKVMRIDVHSKVLTGCEAEFVASTPEPLWRMSIKTGLKANHHARWFDAHRTGLMIKQRRYHWIVVIEALSRSKHVQVETRLEWGGRRMRQLCWYRLVLSYRKLLARVSIVAPLLLAHFACWLVSGNCQHWHAFH